MKTIDAVMVVLCVLISACSPVAHEDEKPMGGREWKAIHLIDKDGVSFTLSCPVRSGGFSGAHNNGCYLKEK